MPAPDERPRWSLTWLFRVQRTGRNRPEREADGTQTGRRAVIRGILIAVIGGILLVEIGIATWLGIWPI